MKTSEVIGWILIVSVASGCLIFSGYMLGYGAAMKLIKRILDRK